MIFEGTPGYEWIFQKGVAIGVAQRVLLIQGRKKFGPSTEAVEAKLMATTDIDRLHRMVERIFDATSWDDLLATA